MNEGKKKKEKPCLQLWPKSSLKLRPDVQIFIFLERTQQDSSGPFNEELELAPEAPRQLHHIDGDV